MFATLFYEVRSTGVTHGTELFVLHAAIKAIFSLAAEGSHYEVFPRKKDLMDNDSVIDLLPPKESRFRNSVLLSTSTPFATFREPPLISKSLDLSLPSISLHFLPPGSIEQSPLPPFVPLSPPLLLLTTTAIHQM